MNGVEAIAAIRAASPDARIIILTLYDGDEDIYRGLQAGARGYLLKDATSEELFDAIRSVHAGKKIISASVGTKLAERFAHPQLSDREQEVIKLLATGKSNQDIATAMSITESTVKFHINNILNKLRVSDRTQAVLVALRCGIAKLD